MHKAMAILMVLACAGTASAQNGDWVPKAQINVNGSPRVTQYHVTVTHNGNVYILGGRSQVAGAWSNDHGLLRYDPLTDSWSSLASIDPANGTSWIGIAAAVQGDTLFQFGGGETTLSQIADTWRYDIASNAWMRMRDLPEARQFGAAVTVGDRIWFLGGWHTNGSTWASTDVSIYDPDMDTWSTGVSLPPQDGAGHGLRSFGFGAIGTRLYVAGGYANYNTPSLSCYSINLPSPAEGWIAEGDIPDAFNSGASAVANDRLYVMGGLVDRNAVYEYEPTAKTWAARQDLPGDRYHCSAAAVGDRIYLPGGVNQSSMLEFTPPSPPQVFELYQSAASGPHLPEGAWVKSLVEVGAMAFDPYGNDVIVEGQIADAGTSYDSGIAFTKTVWSGAVAQAFNFLAQGAYHWRCRAVSSTGLVGAWVEFGPSTVHFNVDDTAPTTPTPIAPSGIFTLATKNGGDFDFSWTPAADDRGPVCYEIVIATDPGFEKIVLTEMSDDCEGPIHLDIPHDNHDYLWRVRAVDLVGNAGPWSEAFTLTIHFDDGIVNGQGDATKFCGFGATSDPHLHITLLLVLLAVALRRVL